MGKNTDLGIVVEAVTKGLSQVIKDMHALNKALAQTKTASEAAVPSQDKQAHATKNQGKAAHDATEALGKLNKQHNNTARQMSDLARSSSAAVAIAYAEIAATAFSLSAAFEFLKSSAEYENLIKSQRLFAQETGTNLGSVGKLLQEATGYAIKFQEAASLATVGKTAGFTTEQMTKLASRAKAAAIIMGRDVPDALSRAFRGVAKGEPEILDELGVFIRLDKAYKEYAKTLDTTSEKLTALQQKQAIYMAFMKASTMYQPITDLVDPDPFTQAQAAFQTTIKELSSAFTSTIGPFVKYLSENSSSLLALALILGGKSLMSAGKTLFNPAQVKEQIEGYKALIAADKKVSQSLMASRSAMGTFTTQASKNKAFASWFESIDEASKSIDKMGIAGKSKLTDLNEAFKNGTKSATEFMEALSKPGKGSINSMLQGAYHDIRDKGSASFRNKQLDTDATLALMSAMDKYKRSAATALGPTLNLANATSYVTTTIRAANAQFLALQATVAKGIAYVKLFGTAIMSVAMSLASIAGTAFIVWELFKMLSDWADLGATNVDKLSSSLSDAAQMIEDSSAAIQKANTAISQNGLTTDTALQAATAQAGFLTSAAERMSTFAKEASKYNPGFFTDGLGEEELDKLGKMIELMESSPEALKALESSARSYGKTIAQVKAEIKNKVFDDAATNMKLVGDAASSVEYKMNSAATAANNMVEAQRNLSNALRMSSEAMEAFAKSRIVSTSADKPLEDLKKLRIELESFAKDLSSANKVTRDSATQAVIANFNSNRELLGLGGLKDMLLGQALTLGPGPELAKVRLEQMLGAIDKLTGGYSRLETAEKKIGLVQATNANVLASLSAKYGQLIPNYEKYTSQLTQIASKEAELVKLQSQADALARQPDSASKREAVADTANGIRTLTTELSTLRMQVKGDSILEGLFGAPKVVPMSAVNAGISELVGKLKEAGISLQAIGKIQAFLKLEAQLNNFKATTTLAFASVGDTLKDAIGTLQKAFGPVSMLSQLENMKNAVGISAADRDKITETQATSLSYYQKAYDLVSQTSKIELATAEKKVELESKISGELYDALIQKGLIFKGYSDDAVTAITNYRKEMEGAAAAAAKMDLESKLSAIDKAPQIAVEVGLREYKEAALALDKLRSNQQDTTEAEANLARIRAGLVKSAEDEAKAKVSLSQTTIDQINATYEQRQAQLDLIDAYKSTRDAIKDLFDVLASGKSLSEIGDLGKEKLPDLFKGQASLFRKDAFKQLKDKFSLFRKTFEDSTTGLPGIVGKTIKGFEGIKTVLGDKLPGISSGIGAILSGNKNGGFGQILGTLAGGPIGGLIGGLIGGAIGKKVLKEVGIAAQVSAAGVVSAQDIQIFKKKGLSGSKTIESVVGSISSDALLALQDSISKIRRGFVSNIQQLGTLTSGAFKANMDAFAKFAYSGRFTVAAGTGTEALFEKVSDGYGSALVGSLAPVIEQFKIANESLASTLERLVAIVKTTDAAFETVFLDPSEGFANLLSDEFIRGTSAEFLQKEVDKVMSGRNAWQIREATIALKPVTDYLSGITDSISEALSQTVTKEAFGDSGVKGGANNFYWQAIRANEVREQFAKSNELYIKYLEGTATDAEKMQLAQLAKLDFYNKMFAAFEGATVDEKRKNFESAMAKYSESVSSSLELLTNQFDYLAMELSSVSGLPKAVKAASNGIITPIFAFNEQLKAAIRGGASPSEVAQAIQVGAKLGEIIQNILQVFSSINISNISTKTDFMANMMKGISDTFKSSLLDQFKKTLVSPILSDILAGNGTSSLNAGTVTAAGDELVNRAKELVGIMNNPATQNAMSLVGTEFERLMSVFGSLDSASTIADLSKLILSLTSDLKQAAFDFLVDGDAYSSTLFKVSESLKLAGLEQELGGKPLIEVFDKVRALAAEGKVNAGNIDAVTDALKAMAEATKLAREQLKNTVDATASLVNNVFGSIKDITMTIAKEGGDIDKASMLFADLLKYPADQLAKARAVYQKAKASGDLLAAAKAGTALSEALTSYMGDQISMQEALRDLANEKYEEEKKALEEIIDWTKELAGFAKDLRFDENLSILAPISRLEEAGRTFDQLKQDLLLKSASSTLTAEDIKSLQEDSRRLLELGRDVYASGDQYTALYNEVQALISGTIGRLDQNQDSLEASTTAYQNSSLQYAQQIRDIQMSTLGELKLIGERAAYDNAVSVQMLDAIKFNQSLPSGLVLSDYYAKLMAQAQSGIGTFTPVGSGFPEFTQGTAKNQSADSAPSTTDLNERLVQTLERLEVVLAMLPLDMRNAVINQQTATRRS